MSCSISLLCLTTTSHILEKNNNDRCTLQRTKCPVFPWGWVFSPFFRSLKPPSPDNLLVTTQKALRKKHQAIQRFPALRKEGLYKMIIVLCGETWICFWDIISNIIAWFGNKSNDVTTDPPLRTRILKCGPGESIRQSNKIFVDYFKVWDSRFLC